MTLNEVMTQTADAIREKTGKSEKIAPINFAEEIKSISAGGGSYTPTIEYYLFTYSSEGAIFDFIQFIMACMQAFVVAAYFKSTTSNIEYSWGQCLIGGSTLFGEFGFQPWSVKAFKITYIAGAPTLIDYLNEIGLGGSDELPLLGLTPCTKEEYEALITE